uniref:D-aminoacyl-tRNA deacylase n=1 Tax=Ningiella ruwaisensis TaxID=2364274 RepID=UPI00109FFB27|nr:D-aminoacyl-tRNA deacylase [Ningiella ruwaisensis]
MIGLIQRVSRASVSVNQQVVGRINQGILLLLGVEKTDTQAAVEKLAKKVTHYRIFNDENGKMNLSLIDIDAELLVVSQFTLVAQTDKGNRPGFSQGASPEHGKAMYEAFIAHTESNYLRCEKGVFGADMKIELVNDGPVTFQFRV